MLSILLMSRCRGTVLKALLMTMAASKDPLSIVCMRYVSRVDVECCDLKPCC